MHKVGGKVTDLAVGDRVYYHASIYNKNGGFAEFAIANALAVVKLPESVSFIDAASLPVAGW